jgi:hypothetical protein
VQSFVGINANRELEGWVMLICLPQQCPADLISSASFEEAATERFPRRLTINIYIEHGNERGQTENTHKYNMHTLRCLLASTYPRALLQNIYAPLFNLLKRSSCGK